MRFLVAGGVVGWIGLVAASYGSPEPVSPKDLSAQIERMARADVEERDAAFAEILALGAEDPEGTLARLPAGHEDPEAAAAIERLRKRIPWEARRREALAIAGEDAARRKAVGNLFDKPGRDGFPRLLQAFRERKEDAVRIAAPFLAHEKAECRMGALYVLARARHRASGDRIAACLEDPSPLVRKAACQALGGLGERRHAAALASRLDDPAGDVAWTAAGALGSLAGENWPKDPSRIAVARRWWEAHKNDPAYAPAPKQAE